MSNKIALIRRPGPKMADGLVTHIEKSADISFEKGLKQWENYVQILHDAGWETIEVEPADDCPDSVFIEDPILVYEDLAIITRPGADERKPETAGAEKAARQAGYRVVRIEAPGTLDGGDVLKFGGKVWVGQAPGGRTNAEGVRQLSEYLKEFGAKVIPVELTKVLHLKSAVTALYDGTIIGYEPLVDDPTVWEKFLAVPEESGSHVVLLEDNKLLMSASAPKTKQMFEKMGYEVVAVDIGEFEKLEGCVTCLSVRLRGHVA
ncbi:MAG: N(G),N(G)-dimethylarginine dimethylaminohydrolase [Actinomycetaceae bacterium]|nr:N(G),N(G)-dimethylarginine dimethylaminohydrolase [Actinomycetaceae bacterium]